MSTMTRDRVAAERIAATYQGNIGKTSAWGRITETIMGATITEREFSGRPLFVVTPQIHNHDPLFDGGLPRDVREARAAFKAGGR